jgi:hypothetical protein
MKTYPISPFLLQRWMNARKLTPVHLSAETGWVTERFARLLAGGECLTEVELLALAEAVKVSASALVADEEQGLRVLVQTALETRATCRQVHRDGIHFYNYYTLPGKRQSVKPVILDILCPADRLPALNNGHLEPAITVNLGPGPIHARWGEKLDATTWQILEADPWNWVVGDSYIESSYRPHSYSLASDQPARIVSYTVASGLASFIAALQRTDAREQEWVYSGDDANIPIAARIALRRRMHTVASLAKRIDVPEPRLRDALAYGDSDTHAHSLLVRAGAALQVDYRILLASPSSLDKMGKRICSVRESAATCRSFCSYQVCDMAHAAELGEITGAFMKIASDEVNLDLGGDASSSHYLVTGGKVKLHWIERDEPVSRPLTVDDSAWIAPFVIHGFSGKGSLLRLGSGGEVSDGTLLEASRTSALQNTLLRGVADNRDWGYD